MLEERYVRTMFTLAALLLLSLFALPAVPFCFHLQAEGRHGVQPERGVAGRALVGGGEKGLRGKGYGHLLGGDRRYVCNILVLHRKGKMLIGRPVYRSFRFVLVGWLAGLVILPFPYVGRSVQ